MIDKLVATAALALIAATPASAETLREALVKAYRSNPSLTGARAQQRANDENVALARSRALPNVGLTGGVQENLLRTSSFTPARQFTGGVNLAVPIYAGGSIRNAIRAADARVDAGVANLRDTESSLFSQVVATYMDVIRDQAIVGLNRAQVGVLDVNLRATRDRFQIGDLTRTDVAQSEARLATARSQLQQAEARLIGSREDYVRLVGEPPIDLQPPPPLPNLPASPAQATAVAVTSNPALLAVQQQREAARFDTNVARASRLPQLSAVGGANYFNNFGSVNTGGLAPGTNTSGLNSGTAGSTGLQATIPLFQGGGPGAQVRQAQARESQAIEAITEVERNIVAQTRSAYASLQASNAVIASSQVAVDANALSLEGTRAENSVGTRTILEILNAEQELLNSQVTLVTARRDAYVAGFSLLAAMGQAEAQDLGLEGGPLYDPEINYRRVRNRVNDFASDPTPAPVATRTVDTPPQTPALMGPPVR